jgi:preprotein translocase subunit YajC
MIPFLVFALLLVAFYALIVRPQRRQMQAHRALVASLEVGDEIITSGGVYGTIRSIDEAVLDVEITDGVVVRVARGAVASRTSDLTQETTGETVGDDGASGPDGTTE